MPLVIKNIPNEIAPIGLFLDITSPNIYAQVIFSFFFLLDEDPHSQPPSPLFDSAGRHKAFPRRPRC